MDRLAMLEERVKTYLAELGVEPDNGGEGIYLLSFGTTAVICTMFADRDDAWVRVAAMVLTEVEPSLELLQRVLRLNTQVLVGSFLLFEDDTLAFSATLPGDDLSFTAFEKTLMYVASIADEYDDVLLPLAGGRRARDVLDGV